MNNDMSSIENDIEQIRERLAGTIDELVYRASPKTIVNREVSLVKAFFVDDGGQPRADNIAKVVGGVVGVVAFFAVARRILR